MKSKFNSQTDFIVRNSVVVLMIISIVFLCMLASIFKYNTDLGNLGFAIVAALIPFVWFLIRKKIKTAIIRINRNGIYSYGKLVTDWRHFKSATTDQLPLDVGDPTDKVVLIIDFYSEYGDKLLQKQLRLYNTLNKSEEQILAAIEFFRNLK